MEVHGKYDRVLHGKIWGSKQEAKMWRDTPLSITASMLAKIARPHVLQGFSSVPPEFQGWDESTTLDFHGENWPNPALADQIMSSFQQHSAVAIPKGGRWFAISFPTNMSAPATIVPIDPADAKDMVSFPEDWEKYVEVEQAP